MNQTLKNYLISSAVTFVTAFVVALGSELVAGAVTPATFSGSVLFGVIMLAARAGFKALTENVINPFVAKMSSRGIGSKAAPKKKRRK